MPSVIFLGDPLNGTAAGELIVDVPNGATPDTTIFGNDGNDLILGDSDHLFFSYLNAGNISLATATNIDSSGIWSSFANPIIGAAGPHTSIYIEPGAGEQRYFSVTAGAGETIRLDVDFSNGTAWGGAVDTIIDILDAAGNVLATNDDSAGDFGSLGPFDSALTFVAAAGGTYYIRVREFGSGDGNVFEGGEQIFLNVSVTGHAATSTGIESGNDTISGGNGNDIIYGMLGTDTVHGDDGNDVIVSTGFGSYYGDAGDDTIYGGVGLPETLDGGTGIDLLDTTRFTGNYVVDLETGLTNFGGESFVNFENLRSGIGNDTLGGTNGANSIFGGAGNDTINGLDGNDSLSGESGDDTLNGGAGNDFLNGGSGLDTLDGGDGDDQLFLSFINGAAAHGGAGNDTLNMSFSGAAVTINFSSTTTQGATTMATTGLENLYSEFSTANLTVNANGAANVITTGSGNDTIGGIFGADIISSGAGDDLLSAFLGNFALDGGDGIDTYNGNVYLAGGVQYWTLDLGYHGASSFADPVTGTLINIENFIGMQGGVSDHVRGTVGANSISGGTGNDFLYGLGGADTLLGEEDDDLLVGGGGDDDLSGGAGIDNLLGQDGADMLAGGGGDDRLVGATGNDFLVGSLGNDRLLGGDGTDTLNGGDGADRLDGGAGVDEMAGGADNDSYYLSTAADVVIEAADEGTDVVFAGFDYTLGDNVDNLQLLSGTWDGTGNALANTIIGSAGANTLLGLGGDDRLFGEGGPDILSGGAGNDRLFGGVGRDTMTGGGGTDRFVFEEAADLGQTIAAADIISDFNQGDGDRIQLTGVDAIQGGGDNAFSFIGTDAFSGTAGELRYFSNGTTTFVEMDVDGDALSDFAIRLTGDIDLVAADFFL